VDEFIQALDWQKLISIVTFAGMAFAIWKQWQQSALDSHKQTREDLESDYQRVKQERDGLLTEKAEWKRGRAEWEREWQQLSERLNEHAAHDARLLRLLVVEDKLADALLMLHGLRQAGYDVFWTCLTKEAELCIVVSAQVFDCAILDHHVPGMRADVALKHIRAAQPQLPVIVVSGVIDEDEGARLMSLGARDFVCKTDLARLAPAIQRELARVGHTGR